MMCIGFLLISAVAAVLWLLATCIVAHMMYRREAQHKQRLRIGLQGLVLYLIAFACFATYVLNVVATKA